MRKAGTRPLPGGRSPRALARGSQRPWIMAGAVGLTIAASAWWMASRARRAITAVDPLAGLRVSEAHDRGIALARSGDPLGAVPYLRRVVALRPDSWNGHTNLAGALGNAAQQARVHLGRTEIATRSSVERVELMRETLRETEAAEGLVPAAADRATVLFERGRALQTWGFPIEALVFFRIAYTAAPERGEIAESLRLAQQALASGQGSE